MFFLKIKNLEKSLKNYINLNNFYLIFPIKKKQTLSASFEKLKI